MNVAGVIALSSGAFYGLAHVLTKKSLTRVNAATITQMALAVNSLLLWALTLAVVPKAISYKPAIWIFVLDGVFLYGSGRLFLYMGFDRIGISRAAPISSSSPFFAVLIAIIFLKEKLTLPILLGTILILTGVVLLSRDGTGGAWRRRDLIFPLLTAVLWGLAQNTRKWGINQGVHPLLGAAISSSTSSIFFPLVFLVGPRYSFNLERWALRFVLPVGLLTGTGYLMQFYALKLGSVVLVAPLASVYPLFSVGLAHLFIGGPERLTLRIVGAALISILGAASILSGETLISLVRSLF